MTVEEMEAFAESEEHLRSCVAESEGVGSCCIWALIAEIKEERRG